MIIFAAIVNENYMELEQMNECVHQTPAYTESIKNPSQAKAFFRLLWFDLGLDFNPDDDFAGYGVFDDEAAELLNKRMDEAFKVLGEGIYDVAFNIMSEENKLK